MRIDVQEFNQAIQQALAQADERSGIMYRLLGSVEMLLGEDALQGKAYDSVKNYFSTYHIPVLHGFIVMYEVLKGECLECSKRLAALDGDLVMDTDELERILEELREELSRMTYLELVNPLERYADDLFYIQRAIGELQEKLTQVLDFEFTTSWLFEISNCMLEEVVTGVDQMGQCQYNEVTGCITQPAVHSFQWAERLETAWKSEKVTSYRELHRYYWERTDGYFDGYWWDDPVKLSEATEMLEKEALRVGSIDMAIMSGEYHTGEFSNRFATIQALCNTPVTGHYNENILYHIDAKGDGESRLELLGLPEIRALREQKHVLKGFTNFVDRSEIDALVKDAAYGALGYAQARKMASAAVSPVVEGTGGAKVKWTGENFKDIGKTSAPSDLVKNLESSGWTKTVEAGGGKSGPATILKDPITGTKVRIHSNPTQGKPYFRVQNKGGGYLDNSGKFPSGATRQELRDLTHFYFE